MGATPVPPFPPSPPRADPPFPPSAMAKPVVSKRPPGATWAVATPTVMPTTSATAQHNTIQMRSVLTSLLPRALRYPLALRTLGLAGRPRVVGQIRVRG